MAEKEEKKEKKEKKEKPYPEQRKEAVREAVAATKPEWGLLSWPSPRSAFPHRGAARGLPLHSDLPEEYEDLTPEQEASLPPVKDPTKNVPYGKSATIPDEEGFSSSVLMDTIQAFSPEGGDTPEEARAKTKEYWDRRLSARERGKVLEEKEEKRRDDLTDYLRHPEGSYHTDPVFSRVRSSDSHQITESLLKLHEKGHLTLSPELLKDIGQYLRSARRLEEHEASRDPYRENVGYPTDYDEEFGVPVERYRGGKPEAPGKK